MLVRFYTEAVGLRGLFAIVVHCRLYEGVEPMGRGRAKAKQTKVARELKYSSPETDLDALQRELSHASSDSHRSTDDAHDTDEDDTRELRRR